MLSNNWSRINSALFGSSLFQSHLPLFCPCLLLSLCLFSSPLLTCLIVSSSLRPNQTCAFLHLFQKPPESQPSPDPAPTAPSVQPSSLPPRQGVSGTQRRAQALRLGALTAELEKTLQSLNCSEKELRTLDNQILHLATILKVYMS